MLRPEQLARNNSEHGHQAALFSWAAIAHLYGLEAARLWAFENQPLPTRDKEAPPVVPCLRWLHAIPNGGSRGDTDTSRRIAGGQMKAEGVKPGVSDVFLPMPGRRYAGLYIEMKTTNGEVSEKQAEFLTFVSSVGYSAYVCWSWIEAVEVIEAYLYNL